MGNTLLVDITPQDFREAKYFVSPWFCPLAIALKKLNPNEEISVGPTIADVGLQRYRIRSEWGVGSYSIRWIDDVIKRAKESLDGIPTVSVTLELIY
jgi:hypothetical protein